MLLLIQANMYQQLALEKNDLSHLYYPFERENKVIAIPGIRSIINAKAKKYLVHGPNSDNPPPQLVSI